MQTIAKITLGAFLLLAFCLAVSWARSMYRLDAIVVTVPTQRILIVETERGTITLIVSRESLPKGEGWRYYNYSASRDWSDSKIPRYALWLKGYTLYLSSSHWLLLCFVCTGAAISYWLTRKTRFTPQQCQSCGYDLRGTLAAGRTVCPECGENRKKSETAKGPE